MKMKSFLAILLAICLLGAGVYIMKVTSRQADSQRQAAMHDLVDLSSRTISEYDMLKEQQAQAGAVLAGQSASQQDRDRAQEVLAIDPVKHFYDLQAKGQAYLQEQGYPTDQMQAILAFDGSEEAIYHASASLATDLLILSRDKYTGGRRVCEAKYIFSWHGIPSFHATDLVTLTSSHFYYASGSSVVYYADGSGTERFTEYPTVKTLSVQRGHAVGIDLSMQKISSGICYHPVSGYISATFDSLDFRQTNIGGLYAHTLLSRDEASSASFDPTGYVAEIGMKDQVVGIP